VTKFLLFALWQRVTCDLVAVLGAGSPGQQTIAQVYVLFQPRAALEEPALDPHLP